MTSIVREFSPVGPCLILGELVRETACYYVFRDRSENDVRRIAKKPGLVHLEPCVSCRDHPSTQYPDGYMD